MRMHIRWDKVDEKSVLVNEINITYEKYRHVDQFEAATKTCKVNNPFSSYKLI